MIQAARAAQRSDLEAFSDGLRDWLTGEHTVEGDAAGMTVAETILLHRGSLTKG